MANFLRVRRHLARVALPNSTPLGSAHQTNVPSRVMAREPLLTTARPVIFENGATLYLSGSFAEAKRRSPA